MILHVMFEREPGAEDVCWVVDAVDEYTVDEWQGAYPTEFQRKLDADPINRRVLDIEIPGLPSDLLWPPNPTVPGRIVEAT